MKKMNNNIDIRLGCSGLVVAVLVAAGGLVPKESQAQEKDGAEIANRNAVAVERDPFWPIGHKPTKVRQQEVSETPVQPVEGTGQTDWEEAMKQVVINGVSSKAGSDYFAVINNEVKTVGELVSFRFKGRNYTWKVESITPPGSVKLRRHTVE